MLTAFLVLLGLVVGIFIGYSLGIPGPLWPFKTGDGTAYSAKQPAKSEIDGFMFDPTVVASIPDEAWMKLKDNPDAIRRYIDQRAHSSAELSALREGVVAARNESLRHYRSGNLIHGGWAKEAAEKLEQQADKLQ